LASALSQSRLDWHASDNEVDIADRERVNAFAGGRKAGWIVNCAAYTAVDSAETERDEALRVNALGAENLARIAADTGAVLVHFSTDYVFDGAAKRPYREDDAPHPLNVYGRSKLEGERRIAACGTPHFIFRLSGLYGLRGNSFVLTMLRLLRQGKEIRVVNDQIVSPTYAGRLAENLLNLIRNGSNAYGTYHYSDAGRISWFDFAVKIGEMARGCGLIEHDIPIRPVSTGDYRAQAPRPAYSVLDKKKVKSRLNFTVRDWKENLRDFFAEYQTADRRTGGG
jgi:dTDP-4-dehydrorhamnose reductase